MFYASSGSEGKGSSVGVRVRFRVLSSMTSMNFRTDEMSFKWDWERLFRVHWARVERRVLSKVRG